MSWLKTLTGKAVSSPLKALALALALASFTILASPAPAAPWKLDKPAVVLSAPDSFKKVDPTPGPAALCLYDPKLNMEIVISNPDKNRVSLDDFDSHFPKVLALKNHPHGQFRIISNGRLKSKFCVATFFILENVVPEKINTAYVYLLPPKGQPFSIIANFPTAKSAESMNIVRAMVDKVQLQ